MLRIWKICVTTQPTVREPLGRTVDFLSQEGKVIIHIDHFLHNNDWTMFSKNIV